VRILLQRELISTRQDQSQRQKIESLNALSGLVYDTKTQFSDPEGWYSKVSVRDKEDVREMVSEVGSWVEAHGATADHDELEDRFNELQRYIQAKVQDTEDEENDWLRDEL